MKNVKTMELLKAGVHDSTGDYFTRECLEFAVEEFKESVWITHDFSGQTEAIQGQIESVELVGGDTIMAHVKIFPTSPAGKCVRDDFELAAAGRLEMADMTVDPETKSRTIHKLVLTGAALVPKGTKVK